MLWLDDDFTGQGFPKYWILLQLSFLLCFTGFPKKISWCQLPIIFADRQGVRKYWINWQLPLCLLLDRVYENTMTPAPLYDCCGAGSPKLQLTMLQNSPPHPRHSFCMGRVSETIDYDAATPLAISVGPAHMSVSVSCIFPSSWLQHTYRCPHQQ